MKYNSITELLYERGGFNKALVFAMYSTERYKLLTDELQYMENSRDILRSELLTVYTFLENLDMLDTFLDFRDCKI